MNTTVDTSENNLAMIYQKLSEQSQKLHEQSQELNQLRQNVAELRNGSGHHNVNAPSFLEAVESSALTDRRGMLKKAAGFAMGVATVGLLQPSSSSAAGKGKLGTPDATGGNFIIGQQNLVTAATDITSLTCASATTLVDTLFLATNFGSTNFVNPGGNIASVGYINNAGTGQMGNLYGIYGESRHTGGGFSYGVYGISDDVGVYGEGGNDGCGVDGMVGAGGSAIAFGVRGQSSNGVGGAFAGGRAALLLGNVAGAVANPNASVPSAAATGDFYRSSVVTPGTPGDGGLWYRTSGNTNSYRRLADDTTAGSLSVFSPPQRLVDTRTGSGFFDAGNHYLNDTLRIYNIRTLANPDLPTGVRAVVGRITVVGATASGVIQVSPNPPVMGNDLGPGTAVVNYPTSSVIFSFGATFVSALDSIGQLNVRGFMAGGGTVDVIIDIVGYYI